MTKEQFLRALRDIELSKLAAIKRVIYSVEAEALILGAIESIDRQLENLKYE